MCAIQKVKIILPYILEGEERGKMGRFVALFICMSVTILIERQMPFEPGNEDMLIPLALYTY